MVAAGGGLPKVGELLNDKYELVRTLGEGGMAVVFEARHNVSGQRVALKVLAPELTRDPEIVARFDREARAVGRLRTRHVAHVLEVDRTRDGGVPFIVMDFLDGCDLAKELENRKTLPVGEAIDYVLQACAAMDEAHRAGIIHRDLKPANLFLTNEPGAPGGGGSGSSPRTRIVKVLDFGISKLVGETSKLTGAGAVMGTVIYMSPEQVKSSSDVDRRTDIWSIGVILFELLTGRAPFEGPGHKVALAIVTQKAPNVRSFAPDIPEPVALAIDRMLERDLHLRFNDMRELATALAPFVTPGSVGAAVVPMLGGGTFSPPMRSAMAGKTMPLERAVMKKTLPLAMSAFVANSGTLNPPSPPSSIAPASASASASLAPISQPTPSSNRIPPQGGGGHPFDGSRGAPTIKRTRGRRNRLPALIAGGALGVLAAIGVVLIGMTMLTTSSGRSKTAAASSSSPAPPPPAANTHSTPTLSSSEPLPPPTMGRTFGDDSASSSSSAAAPSAGSASSSHSRAGIAAPSPSSSAASSSSPPKAATPPNATPTSNPQLL
jgi:serine/threonine protein kinase